jgi:hypothetical protein
MRPSSGRSRIGTQRTEMKPKPQTQASGKAKTSQRTRRRLNATIVARPDITCLNVGPKEVARKAKDRGGAEA